MVSRGGSGGKIKMPIDELNEIISYLADLPSSGDLRLHAEDYFAEDRRQGEEYDKSRAEIKQDEGGFKAEVYLDSEGYPTIGVGHKLTESEIGEYGAKAKYLYTDAGKARMRRDFTRDGKVKTWSADKGEEVFRVDFDSKYNETRGAYNMRRKEVSDGMTWDELPEAARYTLLNMGYNMGGEGLRSKFPSLLRATAAGKWELAAYEIKYKSGAQVLAGGNSLYSTYYAQLSGGRVGWEQKVHPYSGRPIRTFEEVGKDGKTHTWEQTEMRGHMEVDGKWASFPTLDWDGTVFEDYRKAYEVAIQNKEVKMHKTSEEAENYNIEHSAMLEAQLKSARANPIQAARSRSQFDRMLSLSKPKQKTDSSNTAQSLQNELKDY